MESYLVYTGSETWTFQYTFPTVTLHIYLFLTLLLTVKVRSIYKLKIKTLEIKKEILIKIWPDLMSNMQVL